MGVFPELSKNGQKMFQDLFKNDVSALKKELKNDFELTFSLFGN